MACWPNWARFEVMNVLLVTSSVSTIGELHVADGTVGWNLNMTTTIAGDFTVFVIVG